MLRVFEAIERSGYLGPVDNEDFEKYEPLQGIYPNKRVKCDPEDCAENEVPQNMDLETTLMKSISERQSMNATTIWPILNTFGESSSIFPTNRCQLRSSRHNMASRRGSTC